MSANFGWEGDYRTGVGARGGTGSRTGVVPDRRYADGGPSRESGYHREMEPAHRESATISQVPPLALGRREGAVGVGGAGRSTAPTFPGHGDATRTYTSSRYPDDPRATAVGTHNSELRHAWGYDDEEEEDAGVPTAEDLYGAQFSQLRSTLTHVKESILGGPDSWKHNPKGEKQAGSGSKHPNRHGDEPRRSTTHVRAPYEVRPSSSASTASLPASEKDRESARGVSDRDADAAAAPATTLPLASKWAELVRQGNAEMNMRRIQDNGTAIANTAAQRTRDDQQRQHQPQASDSQNLRPRSSVGQRESTLSAAAPRSGSETNPPQASAPDEVAASMKRYEESELRVITQLQLELAKTSADHKEQLVQLNLRHNEAIAKAVAEERRNATRQLEELEATLKQSHDAERGRLNQTITVLKAQAEEGSSEIDKLKSIISKQNSVTKEIEETLSRVKEEVLRKHKIAEESQLELMRVRSELERVLSEHQRLKSSAGTQEYNLQTRVNQLTSELSQAHHDYRSLQKETDEIQKSLDVSTKQYAELQNKTEEELQKLLTEVTSATTSHREQKEKLETELNRYAGSLVETQNELRAVRQELEKRKEEWHDTDIHQQQRVSELQQSVELLKEKLRNADSRVDDKDNTVKLLHGELLELRPRVVQLSEEKERLALQNARLSGELEKERSRLDELRRQKQSRENDAKETIQILKDNLAEKEKKLARLAGFQDKSEELANVRVELNTWKKRYNELAIEFEDYRTTYKGKMKTKAQVITQPHSNGSGAVAVAPPPPRAGTSQHGTRTSSEAAPVTRRHESPTGQRMELRETPTSRIAPLELRPNEKALQDSDLRPLELRKQQQRLERQAVNGGGSATTASLVQRIRDNLNQITKPPT